MTEKIVGLQRLCHGCKREFVICAKCDRYHWHCSPACKLAARRATFRRASKVYRCSDKGREASRRNQRCYRQRLRRRKNSVSHHSSLINEGPVNHAPQPKVEEDTSAKLLEETIKPMDYTCVVCGRKAYFLEPISGFMRRRPRRRGRSRCYRLRPKWKLSGFSTPNT